MEPGTLVLVRGVLGILELLWGMGYLLGAQADVPPLEGLVFPVLKGDPLSFGFQRVVFPRAMQLGKTAGAAGAPEQGEPGLAEVGGWSRPLMGKGPRHGSCHQGWQDLRGQAVCRLRELPGKREAKAWPGLCPLPGTRPTLILQALTFIIFICFTASISAYMAAALLEFFITLAFLFLYATQYYQRFDRLNWPCLVRVCLPPCCLPHPILGPFFSFNIDFPLPASLLFLGKQGIQPPRPMLKHGFDPILQICPPMQVQPQPSPLASHLDPCPSASICIPPRGAV